MPITSFSGYAPATSSTHPPGPQARSRTYWIVETFACSGHTPPISLVSRRSAITRRDSSNSLSASSTYVDFVEDFGLTGSAICSPLFVLRFNFLQDTLIHSFHFIEFALSNNSASISCSTRVSASASESWYIRSRLKLVTRSRSRVRDVYSCC